MKLDVDSHTTAEEKFPATQRVVVCGEVFAHDAALRENLQHFFVAAVQQQGIDARLSVGRDEMNRLIVRSVVARYAVHQH